MAEHAHYIMQYVSFVQALTNALDENAPLDVVEMCFLDALVSREALAQALHANSLPPSGDDLSKVYQSDVQLYQSVKLLQRHNIAVGKWRYLLNKNQPELGWWWQLDRRPRRQGEEIVYGGGVSVGMILGIFFFAVGIVIAFVTTQRLWSRGLDVLSVISLGVQTLIGSGLLTSAGRQLAEQFFQRIVNIPRQLFSWFRPTSKSSLPVANERNDSSLGIFAAGLVFFSVVLTITFIVLPTSARLVHSLAINALEQQNTTTAQTLLTLATQLQPDTLGLVDSQITVSLWQLGNLYESTGDFEAAKQAYEDALSSDGENVLVHHRLSLLYAENGEYNKALLLLDRAIILLRNHLDRREPNIPTLALDTDDRARQLLYLSFLSRGRVLYSMEKLDAARLDLREAEQIVRDYASLFDQPQGLESLSTIELNLYTARVFQGLYYQTGCTNEDARRRALEAWSNVRNRATNRLLSAHNLWGFEATDAIRQLNDQQCLRNGEP